MRGVTPTDAIRLNNDFRWPIEQINAFILRSSLYWRLKFSNEDGIVYAYKFLLQRSRKYDE